MGVEAWFALLFLPGSRWVIDSLELLVLSLLSNLSQVYELRDSPHRFLGVSSAIHVVDTEWTRLFTIEPILKTLLQFRGRRPLLSNSRRVNTGLRGFCCILPIGLDLLLDGSLVGLGERLEDPLRSSGFLGLQLLSDFKLLL